MDQMTGVAESRLKQALRAGRFVLTAEVTPPVSCSGDDLIAKALPLRGLADAVNVTDGAGARAHMDPLAAAAILAQNGIEPILQLACRDRNRIALQGMLMGAAALGVTNLLLLRGDDPGAGDQPDAKPVFDLDSVTLLQTAVNLRDRGELPSGRKVSGAARFFPGVADLPIDPPADWVPAGLKAKVAAGAEFAQTQFCMDVGIVQRYAARLAQHGLLERLSVLIGVVPLRSARSARWIKNHLFGAIIPDAFIERLERAADPAAEGRRICLEVIEGLADIPGVAGVHVMAPNNETAIPPLITEVRSVLRARVAS